jgi:tyrosinase
MSTTTVSTRQAVSALDRSQGSPALLAKYAAGIKVMKGRSEDNPFSLAYQASIHGRNWLANQQRPPGYPRDWDWCQHAHWLFLPWHRMYLLQFERIVGDAIEDPDWRLPYWDYDAPDEARWRIPPEFIGDNKNPLAAKRDRDRIPSADRDASGAMGIPGFVSPDATPTAGFGGAIVTSPIQLGMGTGALENVPHNATHRQIGGNFGDPTRAGLDPLFWLHHANIDRLWERWRSEPDRRLPTDPAWLSTAFEFPDPIEPTGRRTLQVSDVLDIRALGYAYDDVPEPPSPAPPAAPEEREVLAVSEAFDMGETRNPELIGASPQPVDLRDAMTHAVQIQDPREWALVQSRESIDVEAVNLEELAFDAAADARIFLQLEGVRGTQITEAVYDVYLNIPAGDDPADHPELRAGTYGPFGLVETTQAGGSATVGFDITGIVVHLRGQGRWDPTKLIVTFAPRSGDATDMSAGGDLTVERIGLYALDAV